MHLDNYLAHTTWWGLILLVTIMLFCECAFIFGVFFPGDSLLLTVGTLFATQGYGARKMLILSLLVIVTTFMGNSLGYWFGVKSGRKFLVREGGKYLTAENLQKAHSFMNKYGIWSVLFARWIPWVRTLLPLVAGAVRMDKKIYRVGSCLGAITWAPVLLWLGFLSSNSLKKFTTINTLITYVLMIGLLGGIVVGVVMFTKEFRKPKQNYYLPETAQDRKQQK